MVPQMGLHGEHDPDRAGTAGPLEGAACRVAFSHTSQARCSNGVPLRSRIAQERTLCYRFAVVFPGANAIDLSGAKRAMWGHTELISSLARTIGSAGIWLAVAAAGLASATASAAGTNQTGAEPGVFWVYVGTYTSGGGADKSQGIYLLDLDLRSGTLGPPHLACEATDPSFLAVHPSKRFLYAASERGEVDGKPAGEVLGFSINQATGALKEINRQSSRGAGPCHLIVDPSGKNVLVANYGSGSVACLPMDGEGKLAPASAFIQHAGKGADPGRQEGPHAHSINLDRTGRFFSVAAG